MTPRPTTAKAWPPGPAARLRHGGGDPGAGALADPTIRNQAKQALAHGPAVADSCGASKDDVVGIGVLLPASADFAACNEEWSHWFGVDPPARYDGKLGVELPGIPVSIRMTAAVPPALTGRGSAGGA